MTYIDRNIVEAYSSILKGMSAANKMALINKLSTFDVEDDDVTEKKFYASFGAFADERPAQEIVDSIKKSRKFRTKELNF